MSRIAIDPVTRVGGHLRIEVDVAGGSVQDAWSSGTMFRGLESILRGRDPRDAWLLAQRVCGTCTGVHALASVRAVENALGLTIPRNARLIRNLLAGTQLVADHVLHFYTQQAFDWVDVTAALRASPAATATLAASIGDWPQSSATDFRDVQDRLSTLVASRQLGPFANGPWGHPAYTLPPEENLLVLAHYFDALDWHRRFMRIHTLLGGKSPHPQTFLVGGMALAPTWGGPNRALPGEHPQQIERNAPLALSDRGLAVIADLVEEARTFVEQVYVPDTLLIAKGYPAWTRIGAGIGTYMAFGEFPEDDSRAPELLMPRGRVGREMSSVAPVEHTAVAETVAHSHYTYDSGDQTLLQPWDGQTRQRYGGPPPPVTTLEGADKYSWMKAPRYDGEPMEVGPLARVLVANLEGRGVVRAAVQRVVGSLGAEPGGALQHDGPNPGPGHRERRRRHPPGRVASPTSSPTSRPATWPSPTSRPGIPPAGRARPAAGRSASRRAAPSATGSRSRIAGSPGTSSSTRRPGTARRATRMDAVAPARRRWSGRPSPIPRGRWRSCGPSTRSLPARPARSTRIAPARPARSRSTLPEEGRDDRCR